MKAKERRALDRAVTMEQKNVTEYGERSADSKYFERKQRDRKRTLDRRKQRQFEESFYESGSSSSFE